VKQFLRLINRCVSSTEHPVSSTSSEFHGAVVKQSLRLINHCTSSTEHPVSSVEQSLQRLINHYLRSMEHRASSTEHSVSSVEQSMRLKSHCLSSIEQSMSSVSEVDKSLSEVHGTATVICTEQSVSFLLFAWITLSWVTAQCGCVTVGGRMSSNGTILAGH